MDKNFIRHLMVPLTVSLALATLTACGGSGSSQEEPSFLSLGVTDAPVDFAENVWVEFDSLEFKPAGGPSITIEFEPRKIDLYALDGENFEMLVDNIDVPAGNYNWVRLGVNAERGELDSYIVLDSTADIGGTVSLYVPSGSETGLKINTGFIVPVGGAISLMVDFDLRKSVTNPVGQVDDYILKPVLRMTQDSQTGAIQGSISAFAITEAYSDDRCDAGKAAYLYTGSGVVADDLGSSTPPLTTALVEYNGDTDRWDFEFGFVEAGDYTVAMTCDADIDELETDETEWQAIASMDVPVEVGVVSQADLD